MNRSDVKPRARGAGRGGALARDDARHPPARPARLRERLCAGHAARARRGARHQARSPTSPRTRRSCRSPATTSSSSARNGRRSATPMACASASSAPCSRTSCTRPHAPATSTWCRPTPATAASRSSISPCSATPSRPSRLMTRSCCCRAERAQDAALIAALTPLIGAIPVELMREANRRAAENASAEQVARWLGQRIAKPR